MLNFLSIIFNITYIPDTGIGQGPPPPPVYCATPDAWFIVAMVLGPLLLAALGFALYKIIREKRSDTRAERDLIDLKNDEIDRLRAENKAHKETMLTSTQNEEVIQSNEVDSGNE